MLTCRSRTRRADGRVSEAHRIRRSWGTGLSGFTQDSMVFRMYIRRKILENSDYRISGHCGVMDQVLMF